jgi:hypothetical protein
LHPLKQDFDWSNPLDRCEIIKKTSTDGKNDLKYRREIFLY